MFIHDKRTKCHISQGKGNKLESIKLENMIPEIKDSTKKNQYQVKNVKLRDFLRKDNRKTKG